MSASEIQLTVDPEFEKLLFVPTEQELTLLRESIVRDGCREAITVWKTEDDRRIIVDGHNRYKICQDLKIVPQFQNKKFASRDEAKLWMFEHQLGRRNLTDGQRLAIWVDILAQRAAISRAEQQEAARAAKAEKAAGVKPASTEPKPPKDRVRPSVSKESGFTESELRAGQTLKTKHPEHYSDLRAGKPLNAIRKKMRENLRKKPAPTDPRERYAEKDFYARIARGVESAFRAVFLDARLKEIQCMKQTNWTPEAAEGFPHIVKRLREVSVRADGYAQKLDQIANKYKRMAA